MLAAAVAPWWGVPLVAGCFLLIGGLLASIYVRRNDSKRIAADQRMKFDIAVVDIVAEILAFSDGWGIHRHGLTDDQRATAALELREASKPLRILLNKLRLIASDEVYSGARDLIPATQAIYMRNPDRADRSERESERIHAATSLVFATRESIGIDWYLSNIKID